MTFRILVDGQGIYFRLTDASGAIVATRRGTAARQLGGRHPFWRALDMWRSQGSRVGPDGLCIWDYPKPQGGRGERASRAADAA